MKKNREEIIEYINNLKGYQGYVQFSNRKIEDIFRDFSDIHVEEKGGFVYEAHFYNAKDSISIKQINESWFVDESKNISLEDVETYIGIDNLKLTMAQQYCEVEDELCEGMKVKKIEKVVFAGFVNGGVK